MTTLTATVESLKDETVISPPTAVEKWATLEGFIHGILPSTWFDIPQDVEPAKKSLLTDSQEEESKIAELKRKIFEWLQSLDQSFEESLTTVKSVAPAIIKPTIISKLLLSLNDEPIEDGYDHPAEEIIRELLAEHRQDVINWLHNLVENESNYSLIASILKCVGRLEAHESEDWGLELMEKALQHQDVEVRDVSVQAIELWEIPAGVALLKEHHDDVSWLQDYIESVIRDIEES